MRFTCNLCGETSTKAVSPHAWASGSVFARCDGCRVIHKLVGAHVLLGAVLTGPLLLTDIDQLLTSCCLRR